ncbi:HNH endonuclease [Paenarthrobacter nicotinovorans]|uniref:HNH endonuclease n=1 Tax=Paenarthrobacter nicotinovorans TaxID=29320 RepID=UPI00382E02FF
MLRAGGLCELETSYGRRCTRTAEHGDHFYPWSKGGATSLHNFVAACAHCNRRKSARIPSPGMLTRLERRRSTYIGADAAVPAGERRRLRST